MDSLNRWLTFLSNIAVVAGIFFLGVEVSQNSASIKAQTRAQITANNNQVIQAGMGASMSEIFLKLQKNEPLSGLQAMEFETYLRWHFRNAENVFYQYRMGNYSDEEFQGSQYFYKRRFSSPQARAWWQKYSQEFSSEFRGEIDVLLADDQRH